MRVKLRSLHRRSLRQAVCGARSNKPVAPSAWEPSEARELALEVGGDPVQVAEDLRRKGREGERVGEREKEWREKKRKREEEKKRARDRDRDR